MELEGKTAVVTGAGTGIGRATALLFAREGCAVLLAGRRRAPLEEAAAEISNGGGRAECQVTDVSDARQVDRMVERAVRSFGKIDILFNNAGVFISGREAQDYTEAEWRQVLETNFFGTLHGCRAAAPYMKGTGGGVILNCSSVSGRVAQRLQAPYNVSKAAIEMLSKCMALELGPYNIRVNTICPNITETEMTAPAIAARGRAAIEASYPLRRLGQPMDSAYAALYLASSRASWVSGNSLFVDGGSICR